MVLPLPELQPRLPDLVRDKRLHPGLLLLLLLLGVPAVLQRPHLLQRPELGLGAPHLQPHHHLLPQQLRDAAPRPDPALAPRQHRAAGRQEAVVRLPVLGQRAQPPHLAVAPPAVRLGAAAPVVKVVLAGDERLPGGEAEHQPHPHLLPPPPRRLLHPEDHGVAELTAALGHRGPHLLPLQLL